jgi:SAM-dependent methyltransferase
MPAAGAAARLRRISEIDRPMHRTTASPLPRPLILDPRRPQPYRLRLARYGVLAEDISEWAAEAARDGRRLTVLDVGCGWGALLAHLEITPHWSNVSLSATDVTDTVTHNKGAYQEYFIADVTGGYPEIASERYDVVVCEQVLEHLLSVESALATLARLVRPGGRLVIGVPVFFPPLHLARKHLVPRLAGVLRHSKTATHQQAFSLYSFRHLLRRLPGFAIVTTRGFRILSGGILRPLENYRWWWRLNRRAGELVPGLCIEVQFVLRKSTTAS